MGSIHGDKSISSILFYNSSYSLFTFTHQFISYSIITLLLFHPYYYNPNQFLSIYISYHTIKTDHIPLLSSLHLSKLSSFSHLQILIPIFIFLSNFLQHYLSLPYIIHIIKPLSQSYPSISFHSISIHTSSLLSQGSQTVW